MKHYILLALASTLIHLNGCGQSSSKSWKDVNYADDDYEYHRMDIYLPEESKSSYPAVVLIYGSAWFGNNLKHDAFKNLGKPLLESGFAVVTVNHRSSKDAIFPAQINDIKAAIRFIRANGHHHQIDTSFIGITGYSSGGHLSALAGTSGGVKEFEVNTAQADLEGSVGRFTSFSSSVDAVVDWFGPTNFLHMNSCGSTQDHDAPNSPESSLIGGPIQEHPDKCTLVDPITYIDSNDPPFLIFHGDADPLVPHCESQMFYDALQKKNVKSEFVLVPKGGHGPGVFEEKYFKMMTDFFEKESGL